MSEGAPRGRRRRRGGRRKSDLLPLRRIDNRLSRAIESSTADETELVWFEGRFGRAGCGSDNVEAYSKRTRSLQVRVRESDRSGSYRIGNATGGEIADAIRVAIGHARLQSPDSRPPLPNEDEDLIELDGLYDRRIARLQPPGALEVMSEFAQDDEAAILEWGVGQVALRNSRGLSRSARVTCAFLQVRSGSGPGAGFATDAARSLEQLDLNAVFERARRRRSTASAGRFNGVRGPLLLAPEATAELVDLLNRQAFTSVAYREGDSFLREHLGVQVFDQRLSLTDDATDLDGLAFPFDLEGRSKRAVELIRAGVPKTPAVDSCHASDFGLPPTCHAFSCDEAQALNLFMATGEHRESELLEEADEGLWISRLERAECFDPTRVRLRARARGVRKIENGVLGQPLPDLLWEDSLLRIFSNFQAIGRTIFRRSSRDGLLGGIAAPAVVIGEAMELRPT